MGLIYFTAVYSFYRPIPLRHYSPGCRHYKRYPIPPPAAMDHMQVFAGKAGKKKKSK
jgi:hypothetical protein